MVQVCAHCLSIPIEKIHITETSTDKVPNTTPTSASVSTDFNGMAVKVSIYLYIHILNFIVNLFYLHQ